MRLCAKCQKKAKVLRSCSSSCNIFVLLPGARPSSTKTWHLQICAAYCERLSVNSINFYVFFPRTISLHLRFPQVLWEGILRQPTSSTGKLRFESSVAPLGSSWHELVPEALDRRLDEQSSCWWRGGRLPPKLHPGSAGNRCRQKKWKSMSSFNQQLPASNSVLYRFVLLRPKSMKISMTPAAENLRILTMIWQKNLRNFGTLPFTKSWSMCSPCRSWLIIFSRAARVSLITTWKTLSFSHESSMSECCVKVMRGATFLKFLDTLQADNFRSHVPPAGWRCCILCCATARQTAASHNTYPCKEDRPLAGTNGGAPTLQTRVFKFHVNLRFSQEAPKWNHAGFTK